MSVSNTQTLPRLTSSQTGGPVQLNLPRSCGPYPHQTQRSGSVGHAHKSTNSRSTIFKHHDDQTNKTYKTY